MGIAVRKFPIQSDDELKNLEHFVPCPLKKRDAKKQGLRSRKKSSFFTEVSECFSGYFDLISTLAWALKLEDPIAVN